MKLLIGCPVRKREWIILGWLYACEMACRVADQIPCEYIFAMAKGDPTGEIISDVCETWGRPVHWVNTGETYVDTPTTDHRWDHAGYRRMTQIRNALLVRVRELAPERFLSLDSDILIHPDGIASLLEVTDFEAVGGKTYMTPASTDYPSNALLHNAHSLARVHTDLVQSVDVIMAIKMMSPKAYAINYHYDAQGEDVGWSRAATAAGLRLGFDGRVCSKHVMTRSGLNRVDERCGF